MGHHPMEAKLASQLLTTLSLSRVFQVGVFLQGLRSNLMADLFWLFQKRWASIFYVRILKIIRGGIYFISMVFTSYCAEILVWQLKYFSWTEANVKSGSVNRHSQRVCLEFHNTSKSRKFPGWERSQNSHGYNRAWLYQLRFSRTHPVEPIKCPLYKGSRKSGL